MQGLPSCDTGRLCRRAVSPTVNMESVPDQFTWMGPWQAQRSALNEEAYMYGMRSPVHRRIAAVIGVAAIASLTLAGCAEGGSDDGGDSGSVEGETVSISGGITGIEAENMQKSFDQFT